MTADKILKTESLRGLDPNVLQRRASNPLDSVWVSASAGTGKTKVLTDRVLRLLLPLSESQAGTPPHKILCLTFTKAAASEMALRISSRLSQWAVLPEEAAGKEKSLKKELRDLLGRDPARHEIAAARRLFAEVIDSAGGLQIMTIHAFCQSVLGRFPLEAGLTPGFTVLEDGPAAALLHEAKKKIFTRARQEVGSALHNALEGIAQVVSEDQFFQLLLDAQKEQVQLRQILEKNFGNADGVYQNLCKLLDIPPHKNNFITGYCASVDVPELETLCRALAIGTPATDQPKADRLRVWLGLTDKEKAQQFDLYKNIFLNKDGSIPKRPMTKDPAQRFPQSLVFMEREAQALQKLDDKIRRAECAAALRDLLTLVTEILAQYGTLKSARGCLDFDDLIVKTLELLEGRSRPDLKNMQGWVHYKLDQGLDHILIDEAQDTNPQQWRIIEALCEDFFAGQSAREATVRTVFTVGDEKQSIYSFQRASPEEFSRMRAHFSRKITEAAKGWSPVDLNISFRSTPAVLEAVDHVFASDAMRKGLGIEPLQHYSFRRGQAGLVELWPLCADEESPETDPWDPPVSVIESRSGSALLAEKIATTIKGWIERGEILESAARPIRPGDIMILLRTRGRFVEQITRALKARQIPVSGVDRMILNDQLAVQDLLACAEFALLPEDDLTLACILKSPLIGVSEDGLFELCYGREGRLWEQLAPSLLRRDAPRNDEIGEYLQSVIHQSRALPPFEFFSWLLHSPCPADTRSGLRAIKARLGGDALEPLEELLQAALDFEREHGTSLQRFLHWQKHNAAEIKREMEEAGNAVRIMTVHGSKGLQAPIVILPDTMRTSRHVPGQSDKRLLWPDKTGLDVPLWCPRKDDEFSLFRERFEMLETRFDEEYRRLLYVAMTRAEDRLYIGGCRGKREPIAESWYNYIATTLPGLEGVEKLPDGSCRLTNPQVDPADKIGKEGGRVEEDKPLPGWAMSPAPPEPSPPRPLTPSRPSEAAPAAISPLQAGGTERFRRGNLTHKLLQVLPDLEPGRREAAGQAYLQKFAGDLAGDVRADILRETLLVLDHPDFAPLFGPGSKAEVPVTGLLGADTLLSGQIDRLKITDDTVWIVDYKTNRPPPEKAADIPELYRKQMRGYYKALEAIYPGRAIKCALLWTDGPRLMELDFSKA